MKKINNFTKYFCAGLIMGTASLVSITGVQAEHFTVTSYYSPLPKQEFYLMGNYKAELRLNGNGLLAADGTEVYQGMIAAPKNYKFGTKICLEKLGCGVVHDRGGAIVNKGVRKKAVHDRLDYWMGHGNEGLKKSLDWGVQNLKGRIVRGNQNFKLPNPAENSANYSPIIIKFLRNPENKNFFTENIYPPKKSKEVHKLKETLAFLKIYRGEINNVYDADLKYALTIFQKKYGVIANEKSAGAGNFGPKTREKLNQILKTEIYQHLRQSWSVDNFQKRIRQGENGVHIFRLQQLLTDEGCFDNALTGYFGPKTADAVTKFQLNYGLIKNKNDDGSGALGPKTREKMTELWIAKRDSYFPLPTDLPTKVAKNEKQPLITQQKSKLVAEAPLKLVFLGNKKLPAKTLKNEKFAENVVLFRGKKGNNVRKLQNFLIQKGFFRGRATGYFGDKTAEALLAYQIKNGIVKNRRSVGASIFGPATRNKINGEI